MGRYWFVVSVFWVSLLLAACSGGGGDAPVAQTDAPAGTPIPAADPALLDEVLATLDQPLRKRLAANDWYKDGVNQREFLFVRFLSDAIKPGTEIEDISNLPRRKKTSQNTPSPFTSADLVSLMDAGTYDIVDIGGQPMVLAVSPTLWGTQDNGRFNRMLDLIRKSVERVATVKIGTPRLYFLNVQVDRNAVTSHAYGCNVYITDAQNTLSAYLHEIVHCAGNHTVNQVPTWFGEGVATFVSKSLIGEATREQCPAAPAKRAEINRRQLQLDPNLYETYFCLMREVHAALGEAPYYDAISAIQAKQHTATEIIQAFMSNTNDEGRERLRLSFSKWLEGYTP